MPAVFFYALKASSIVSTSSLLKNFKNSSSDSLVQVFLFWAHQIKNLPVNSPFNSVFKNFWCSSNCLIIAFVLNLNIFHIRHQAKPRKKGNTLFLRCMCCLCRCLARLQSLNIRSLSIRGILEFATCKNCLNLRHCKEKTVRFLRQFYRNVRTFKPPGSCR